LTAKNGFAFLGLRKSKEVTNLSLGNLAPHFKERLDGL
jgi:hypothetical protein